MIARTAGVGGFLTKALVLGLALVATAFGELSLRGRVVCTPDAKVRVLFTEPDLARGRVFSEPLGLAPGEHYLSADQVRDLLGDRQKGLEALPLRGDGVHLVVTEGRKDPFAALVPAFPEDKVAPADVPSSAPAEPEGSRFFYCFERRFEGARKIPKGTQVLLAREGGVVSLQLSGVLVRDWIPGPGRTLKIKLLHSDKVMEESVPAEALVWY